MIKKSNLSRRKVLSIASVAGSLSFIDTVIANHEHNGKGTNSISGEQIVIINNDTRNEHATIGVYDKKRILYREQTVQGKNNSAKNAGEPHRATFEFNKSVSSGEYQFSVSIQSGESAEMPIQLGPHGLPPSNRVVVKINPSSNLSLGLSHL
jgi:hypothetical protein